MADANRNASELLFEEYLTEHGHRTWTHEPFVQGKMKKLDYRLEHDNAVLFFEVKEFNAPPLPLEVGTFEPYGPIRAKINQATRQFKEYKEYPCSLVLANPKSAFVQLAYPWVIFGAMLGDLGFRVPVGPNADPNAPTKTVFLGGGKMIDQKRRRPQNTTVSAIIVVGTFPLREKNIQVAIKNRQAELGRRTTLEEDWEYSATQFPKHRMNAVSGCMSMRIPTPGFR